MSKYKQKLSVRYDRRSDVLYLGAKRGIEEEFVEIAPGVSLELDEKGKAIGIEILNASKILKPISRSVRKSEPVLAK